VFIHPIKVGNHAERAGGKPAPAAKATVTRGNREPKAVVGTLLCTDIADSTRHAATLGDRLWLRLMDAQTKATRRAVEEFGGTVVRDTGDGALALFAESEPAVRSARAAIEATHGLGLELRAGLHTGECHLSGEDLRGIVVHITVRVCSVAEPGQVLITQPARDAACGSLDFSERGSHRLRGLPGLWELFSTD
jgi:class 3 adenylate cyclase